MFAFPNDIQVKLSDDRPRSTWHTFTMTKATGDKVYVSSLTVWHPVPVGTAAQLERQCREWRQGNLSLEERELAESLTGKLASERSTLSSLLLLLPSLMGPQRDQLDEQILQSEEKIALYNELLKPIRTHAAAKVEGLTEGQGMWLPRCYGVLGRESGFQGVWSAWLRAVAVPWVTGEVDVLAINEKGDRFLPLERYVVNLVGEVPLPIQGRTQVEIVVRELKYQTLPLLI
jgi:uDENN domain/DENN (AEX-3) domain